MYARNDGAAKLSLETAATKSQKRKALSDTVKHTHAQH